MRAPRVTLQRPGSCGPNERIVHVETNDNHRITLAIAVLPDGTLVIDPYHAQGRVIVRMGSVHVHAATGLPVES